VPAATGRGTAADAWPLAPRSPASWAQSRVDAACQRRRPRSAGFLHRSAPEALRQTQDRVAELQRDVDAMDLVPSGTQGELRVRVGAAVGELNNAVEDIREAAEDQP
jgi:hypothetical protein